MIQCLTYLYQSTYLYQYELMDYYFIQLVMINIVKVFVVVVVLILTLKLCHICLSGATWSWIPCALACPHPSSNIFLLFSKIKFPASSCTFSVLVLEENFSLQEGVVHFTEWCIEAISWHHFYWSVSTQDLKSPFPVPGYTWKKYDQECWIVDRRISSNCRENILIHRITAFPYGQFIQY